MRSASIISEMTTKDSYEMNMVTFTAELTVEMFLLLSRQDTGKVSGFLDVAQSATEPHPIATVYK